MHYTEQILGYPINWEENIAVVVDSPIDSIVLKPSAKVKNYLNPLSGTIR
jgi:hypothetical protein